MSSAKLHVKAGDTVVVISGEYKKHQGKVAKAMPKENRVVVEGAQMVKRHQKPRGQGMPGGIITKEAPIEVSKVMLVCPSCKKATRVMHKFLDDGAKVKKARVCKKCGATFDD